MYDKFTPSANKSHFIFSQEDLQETFIYTRKEMLEQHERVAK